MQAALRAPGAALPRGSAPAPCCAPHACSPSSSAPQAQQQRASPRAAAAAAACAPRRPAGARRSAAGVVVPRAAAGAAAGAGGAAEPSAADLESPSSLAADAYEIVDYAIKFAFTAEVYEVHSWMLVLGLLKQEKCVAAGILKEQGLEDLYGAWNETLWALNACNGLEPRAFVPTVQFGERARKVLNGAIRFAGFQGREKVQTEDILLALAAAGVWEALFPDVDLSFDTLKAGVERWSREEYKLPGYDAPEAAPKAEDMFL